MFWWITIGLLTIFSGYVAFTFNQLVGLGRRADGAWSDIDVQLKRRWDLIPNLVETVKGYTKHESETLQSVVNARTKATESADLQRRENAESEFTLSIKKLFVLVESYPDLKADESFQSLHHSLVDIEDHLQNARRYYNAVIRDLNTATESFPSLLIAGAFGFGVRPFFQSESATRSVPEIKL